MLTVISPAKNLNSSLDLPKSKLDDLPISQPIFSDKSQIIATKMREFAPHELAKLASTSDKIAELNFLRWQSWSPNFTQENSLPAIFAFNGAVYQNFKATELSNQDLHTAQKHLRIISGLYGILRPLDLIQAYRLEMGTKLAWDSYKNLYDFWQTQLSDFLLTELAQHQHQTLINLASNEYYKAIAKIAQKVKVINIEFKQLKNSQYKTLVIYTKMARGQMARYIIQNQIEDYQMLKDFTWQNYRFNANLSSETDWVFTRDTI